MREAYRDDIILPSMVVYSIACHCVAGTLQVGGSKGVNNAENERECRLCVRIQVYLRQPVGSSRRQGTDGGVDMQYLPARKVAGDDLCLLVMLLSC